MYSEFPVISHIDDVKPYIDDNFIVADKGEYTVINYILPDKETFPEEDNLRSRIRLECRGIIFCNVTGNIIRRPYQKFFNLGERESLTYNAISGQGEAIILSKLDGSMIAPFITASGKLIWGTKMGETHITPKVEEFVKKNPDYQLFSEIMICLGYTPIFEWMNREDRIVLDYGDKPQLVLVAIRDMKTGLYKTHERTRKQAEIYPLPVVKQLTNKAFSEEFINSVKTEEGIEGYVIRFANGNMCKTKCDWYCTIHRAKSYLTKERHVVELILNEKLDDLKPLLLADDLKRLETFEFNFKQEFKKLVSTIQTNLFMIQSKNLTRKDFALNYATTIPKWLSTQIFKHFDSDLRNPSILLEISESLKTFILSKCNRDSVYYDHIVSEVLKNLPRWNAVYIDG